MANHRAGGKITASHTSIIDAALPIVDAAEKLPEVTKISLGIIKQVGRGGRQRRIKFLPRDGEQVCATGFERFANRCR